MDAYKETDINASTAANMDSNTGVDNARYRQQKRIALDPGQRSRATDTTRSSKAQPQATFIADLSLSIIAVSAALTRSPPNPRKPPSLAASETLVAIPETQAT